MILKLEIFILGTGVVFVVEESEFVQSKRDDGSQAENSKPELTPVDDDNLPF